MNIMNKFKEMLIEVRLEMNTEKIRISCTTSPQCRTNHNIKTVNRSFEKCVRFKICGKDTKESKLPSQRN
jgi:hypothetical protein